MKISTNFHQGGRVRLQRSLMLGALIALGSASTSYAYSNCTGSLNGSYGLSVNGSSPLGADKYLTGAVTFNPSSCQVSGVISVSENYTLENFIPVTGTFASNADGTVTVSLAVQGNSTTETYSVGFSQSSNEAVGIETDPTAVASIDIKAQLFPQGFYDTALLNGTWVASCSGVSGTFSDLNYFTLSGGSPSSSGTLKGTDISNRGGQYADNPYSGTYAVLSNGIFGGNLTVAGNYVQFTGVVDNNLSEIRYVYDDAPAGTTNGRGFDFCVAKRAR